MPLIEAKFDQSRIDSLRRYLQREAEKGRSKDYEIMVDGFKIVSRTDNVQEFDDYEHEVRDTTRNISILIYDGPNTPRNTRYSFALQAEPEGNSPKSLNGLGDIDGIIEQRLSERDRDHELQRMKEKLEDIEQQLEESEEYAEGLEKQIEELEGAKHSKAMNIGELTGIALESILKRNLKNIPGGEGLAGLFGGDATVPALSASSETAEGAASFQKASANDAGLTEEQQRRMMFAQVLETSFDEAQMAEVLQIMEHLGKHPQHITHVKALLKI